MRAVVVVFFVDAVTVTVRTDAGMDVIVERAGVDELPRVDVIVVTLGLPALDEEEAGRIELTAFDMAVLMAPLAEEPSIGRAELMTAGAEMSCDMTAELAMLFADDWWAEATELAIDEAMEPKDEAIELAAAAADVP